MALFARFRINGSIDELLAFTIENLSSIYVSCSLIFSVLFNSFVSKHYFRNQVSHLGIQFSTNQYRKYLPCWHIQWFHSQYQYSQATKKIEPPGLELNIKTLYSDSSCFIYCCVPIISDFYFPTHFILLKYVYIIS